MHILSVTGQNLFYFCADRPTAQTHLMFSCMCVGLMSVLQLISGAFEHSVLRILEMYGLYDP